MLQIQIFNRLRSLSTDLDSRYVDIETLTNKIIQGTYPNVTTSEIDTLAAETAASLSTQHTDYARLAARICASHNHKNTNPSFAYTIKKLYNDGNGFIDPQIAQLVERRGEEIERHIVHSRDMQMTYFGFKTLERSYLLKTDEGKIRERPQYMFMRVALGIHCSLKSNGNEISKEEETENLLAAFETYDMMSRGFFTHASPTLFHSGTTHPQLSSCFLVQMTEDSINGIYDTLKTCAAISNVSTSKFEWFYCMLFYFKGLKMTLVHFPQAAGGIGLSVHNIRARGTYIKGTRGISNGLVPMLRVFDVTSRYVDQGGGRRPGAIAIYIEPWHAGTLDENFF